MAWKFSDLDALRNRVQAISNDVAMTQYNLAAEQWQIGRMISVGNLPEEAIMKGYYKYSPQQRLYVSADPTPATCESDPQEVDYSVGEDLSVKVNSWEKKHRICRSSDGIETLEQKVAGNEFAVALGIGEVHFQEFWYGYPQLGTYGLFNHPLGNVSATPAPINPISGTTNFQSKTANEVIGEIVTKMRGMRNPRLAISEKAWSDVADKILGDGNNCNRAGDCILQKIAQSESTQGFTGTNGTDFFVMKWLDNPIVVGVPSEGVYIVWDADAVEYPISDPEFLSAMPQKKRVDSIRQSSSVGAIVKYTDSLCVVTGINELIVD